MPRDNSLDFDHLSATLYTAVVSDVLDQLGHPGHVASSELLPVLRREHVLIGRARTARAHAVTRPPERPYEKLLEGIDQLGEGDVLVIDADGRRSSGIFGGLLATAVRAAGGRGAVVDGGIRDTRELCALEFPTFARGTCPADSFGRDEVVEIGSPIGCGGIEVEQGDLVVADGDGFVVVPQRIEHEVVARALEKVAGENEVRSELRRGMKASEAFARYGIL